MYNLEAAVELLIRGMGGRFARPSNPWIKQETGEPGSSASWWWADLTAVPENVGALSGVERAFVLAAASIGATVPVELGEVMSRLDRPNVALVLVALAHAAGSHEHSGFDLDEEGLPTHFRKLPSLYPWPPDLEYAAP